MSFWQHRLAAPAAALRGAAGALAGTVSVRGTSKKITTIKTT
jgi:hypothetical protein